jgi:hypothetical protein
MRRAVKLSDIHDIALVFQDGSFIIVDIQVIGGGEDGHDGGEPCRLRLAIHSIADNTFLSALSGHHIHHGDIPSILGFMCADDGEEIVPFEELTCCLIPTTTSVGKAIHCITHVKK